MSATELRDAETVEEKAWNVAERSRADGSVRADLLDIRFCKHNGDEEVIVEYLLPNGRDRTRSFVFPDIDSEEYQLVRWLEYNGYTLASLGEMKTDDVKVECRENRHDAFELYVPKRKASFVQRKSAYFGQKMEWCFENDLQYLAIFPLAPIALAAFPLTLLGVMIHFHSRDQLYGFNFFNIIFIFIASVVIWLALFNYAFPSLAMEVGKTLVVQNP